MSNDASGGVEDERCGASKIADIRLARGPKNARLSILRPKLSDCVSALLTLLAGRATAPNFPSRAA
jgi:hypothetical protein